MFHLATSELTHFLTAYGYWAVLLVAAIYAGTTHRLSLPMMIAAAAGGAILGDNLGYWIGRKGGYRLLRRSGHNLGLDERKVKLGQYLFHLHSRWGCASPSRF